MKIEIEIDNRRLGELLIDAANAGYEITNLRKFVTHMLSCCANSGDLWRLIARSELSGVDPHDFEEHGVWVKNEEE